jgi:hypothetical protein
MIKYRMVYEDGSWIETIDLEEAELQGNYIIIEE